MLPFSLAFIVARISAGFQCSCRAFRVTQCDLLYFNVVVVNLTSHGGSLFRMPSSVASRFSISPRAAGEML